MVISYLTRVDEFSILAFVVDEKGNALLCSR